MPHVDEGTLHALLDGELGPEALAEVRIHFATCSSCAARLDEARQLLAETERLVSALELPGGAAGLGRRAAGGGAGGARPASAGTATGADVLRPPALGSPLPPLDPVVLIPENPTIRELRRGRLRVMAWAAGFLVVVGAGYLGVSSFQSTPRNQDGQLRLSPDEFTTAPPRSEREGANADSAPTLALSDSDVPAPELERKAVAEPARTAAPAPAPAAAPAPRPAPPRAAPAPAAPSRADAGRSADDPKDEAQLAKAADTAPRDSAASPTPPEGRPEQSVNRNTAAQATFELDRRRTRERAAEATAALDRELAQRRAAEERERQLAAQRAAAAAPAAAAGRPAADDRTGISSRIGLDEAARQLGGPLHAIDGLSRQMVGLVSGASVEGADPGRPVVRAVYVDRSSGKMLFLDQQMARPGAGPATPQTGSGGRQVWVKDGVLLVLHGDVGPDSLRSLARRVR